MLVRVRGREHGRVLGRVAALEDAQREEELVVPGQKAMPGPAPGLERSRRAGLARSSAHSRIVASGGLLEAAGSAAVPCHWLEPAFAARGCLGVDVAVGQRFAK